MAIVRPDDRLSRADKELILLLGGLLVDCIGLQKQRNYRADETPLSDAEASRLVELLEELLSSKRFLEAAFFVEEISLGIHADRKRLRDIFGFWRSRTGRHKSMTWLHFNEFLRRFNPTVSQDAQPNLPALKPMTFPYFLKMERVLLRECNLSPRVIDLIIGLISKYEDEIRQVRNGERPLSKGQVVAQPQALLNTLKNRGKIILGGATFSVPQIAGIATIVANTSVIFSTRDWSVAGTLSTMSGACVSCAVKG